MRAFFLPLMGLVAACQSVQSLVHERTLAVYGYEGRWVGPVTAVPATCRNSGTGTLMIGPKGFALDPFQSTVVIRGTIDPFGTLSGAYSRPGAEKQSLTIAFAGAAGVDPAGAQTIVGIVTSAACSWRLILHRS